MMCAASVVVVVAASLFALVGCGDAAIYFIGCRILPGSAGKNVIMRFSR